MSLERAFLVCSILLTTVGFLGLVLTGEIPGGLVLIGLVSLVVSAAQAMEQAGARLARQIASLSSATWNVFLLAAFVFFGADLLVISRDILPAAVHFLILLMSIKLFHLRQRKDFLQLYAISFLELLAAAALTVDLWYAGVFIAYVFAAIWTLILYHLRNEAEEARASVQTGKELHDPSPISRPVTAKFFWTTNGIAVGSFCLTMAIFFLIPRIGAGFFQKDRVDLIRTSGFSEKVDLGVIGAVKLDPTVVMRVELPDLKAPIPEGLYFRGAAYNTYDGRSWANRLARRRLVGRTHDGGFKVPSEQTPAVPESAVLRQEILIEALDTTVLFGASFVESVKGNFGVVQMDGMWGLYLPFQPAARFQYSVRSIPGRLLEADRAAPTFIYPAFIREHYLQLRDTSPRVAALSREMTSAASTPYGMARAIEQYLRRSYQYSLDVGTTMSADPIEDFLFTRKTGYCEHYATAMVVLLRTLGIPARLVTGFLPGVWNDFGNYYTIRQQDAHAWVEVYFPRSGWVTFDPTPSVPAAVPSWAWRNIGKIVDSLRLRWDRYVVQYSLRDQMAVAKSLRDRSERVRSEVSDFVLTVTRGLASARAWLVESVHAPGWALSIGLAAVTLVIGMILAVILRGQGRRRQRLDPRTPRQVAAIQLYSRMLRILEARGLKKSPGATPLEFARQVAREWRDAAPVVRPLTDLYCQVRFGEAPLSSDETRKSHDLLARLRAVRR
jgi:protein-glutamine gamma-glutamyltransferase